MKDYHFRLAKGTLVGYERNVNAFFIFASKSFREAGTADIRR